VARPPRELRHGRRGQRPEVEAVGHLVEHLEGGRALLETGRRHDQQARPTGAQREVVQQLRGGAPGIVQVVEHQQHRPGGGQGPEQGADRLERAAGVRRGDVALAEVVGELGEQPGQDAGVVPGRVAQDRDRELGEGGGEGVDHRLEEQRALRDVAAGDRDPGAGRPRGGRELGDQAGLADPGLPGDQDDPRLPGAGALPPRRQARRLGGAAHDR
jgi:hypothetical protein